ncbi:MAG: hypothetical protein AAGH64_09930 [Planctomycetota bacterium]
MNGCHASYVTPGGPADLRAAIGMRSEGVTVEHAIAKQLDREPAAQFPATLALLRLQDRSYGSYTARGWDHTDYSVVTVRDVEDEADLERLGAMPGVRAVAPLNRMVIGNLSSEQDLRAAAARVHADALVLYTFDTRFDVDTTIPALGVLTLGLFPNDIAKVTSTASAAVIDTRTGYVYALAESTHDTSQIANAWTNRDAVDQSRRRAERGAFAGLVGELERAWGGVVRAHAGAGFIRRGAPGTEHAGWVYE